MWQVHANWKPFEVSIVAWTLPGIFSRSTHNMRQQSAAISAIIIPEGRNKHQPFLMLGKYPVTLFLMLKKRFTSKPADQVWKSSGNVGPRSVSWDSMVRQFPKSNGMFTHFEKNTIVCFSQIQFFQEEFYPPLCTFLWVKLVRLLKMQGYLNNEMPY